MHNRSFNRNGGVRKSPSTFQNQTKNSPFQKRASSHFNRGGGGQRGRVRQHGEKIDYARFINKALEGGEALQASPINRFEDFKIDEQLKRAIALRGYGTPTPIQDQAIPHVLQGIDILGLANTGTGKTGAFLIPLINKVLLNRTERILIMAPTRELAIQINEDLRGFTVKMHLKEKIFSVCCVGGMNIGRQISELRYANNFIIGTPGRLKDLIERRMINLSLFNTVVLDEADRMLDMGFVNDMRFLIAKMPKKRQTLFFSATVSSEIEKLIKEFLTNPVRISVKTRDTSKNVEQDVVKIKNGDNKLEVLHDLLNKEDLTKVLIFGRTKHGVERLSKQLTERGFKAESIHGNKNHSKRQKALGMFKDNHVSILVATDVAARGLDIADVSHVINFDIPATYDDYIHRIGRTGRGDKRGKALTFIE